jgi:hypothetical protein
MNHKRTVVMRYVGISLLVRLWPLFLNSAIPLCFGQGSDLPHFVLFGGAGVANRSNALRGGFHFGADYEFIPVVKGHFPQAFILDLGYAGFANYFEAGSAKQPVKSALPRFNSAQNRCYRRG